MSQRAHDRVHASERSISPVFSRAWPPVTAWLLSAQAPIGTAATTTNAAQWLLDQPEQKRCSGHLLPVAVALQSDDGVTRGSIGPHRGGLAGCADGGWGGDHRQGRGGRDGWRGDGDGGHSRRVTSHAALVSRGEAHPLLVGPVTTSRVHAALAVVAGRGGGQGQRVVVARVEAKQVLVQDREAVLQRRGQRLDARVHGADVALHHLQCLLSG
mmetsp:Transcript_14725/g.36714  ORF Transcript_14725/g.36714 Transcript_14725/m.36714 type:complete len:213 (-) Transcript_14725:1571-2209(-)